MLTSRWDYWLCNSDGLVFLTSDWSVWALSMSWLQLDSMWLAGFSVVLTCVWYYSLGLSCSNLRFSLLNRVESSLSPPNCEKCLKMWNNLVRYRRDNWIKSCQQLLLSTRFDAHCISFHMLMCSCFHAAFIYSKTLFMWWFACSSFSLGCVWDQSWMNRSDLRFICLNSLHSFWYV